MSESESSTGPGGFWIWMGLLLAFIGAGIAIYFAGPLLQGEIDDVSGQDSGTPTREISGD